MQLSRYLQTVFRDLLRTKEPLGKDTPSFNPTPQIEWLQYIGKQKAWMMNFDETVGWEIVATVTLQAVKGSLTVGNWYQARGYGNIYFCDGDFCNCNVTQLTALNYITDDFVQCSVALWTQPSNVITDWVRATISFGEYALLYEDSEFIYKETDDGILLMEKPATNLVYNLLKCCGQVTDTKTGTGDSVTNDGDTLLTTDLDEQIII